MKCVYVGEYWEEKQGLKFQKLQIACLDEIFAQSAKTFPHLMMGVVN